MKIFQTIILLIIIVYIYSYCSGRLNPANADDCKNNLSQEDINAGYSHCCFHNMTVTSLSRTACIVINNTGYENIKYLIEQYQANGGIASIDCKSYYLQFGFISLLLFLLYIL